MNAPQATYAIPQHVLVSHVNPVARVSAVALMVVMECALTTVQQRERRAIRPLVLVNAFQIVLVSVVEMMDAVVPVQMTVLQKARPATRQAVSASRVSPIATGSVVEQMGVAVNARTIVNLMECTVILTPANAKFVRCVYHYARKE